MTIRATDYIIYRHVLRSVTVPWFDRLADTDPRFVNWWNKIPESTNPIDLGISPFAYIAETYGEAQRLTMTFFGTTNLRDPETYRKAHAHGFAANTFLRGGDRIGTALRQSEARILREEWGTLLVEMKRTRG